MRLLICWQIGVLMNFENLKKIICLDTETISLDIEEGHRVVELGSPLAWKN